MSEPIQPQGDPKTPVTPPVTPPQDPATPPASAAPSQPSKRSKLESKKVTAARLLREIEDEEGKPFDPAATPENDDDKPVTKGELKRMEREKVKETALSMAEAITDEETKTKVRDFLEHRLVPSGDAAADYQAAVDSVLSEKNRQVAATAAPRGTPSRTHSGAGAPPPAPDGVFEPTEMELRAVKIAKIPADKQKDWIMKVRKEVEQADRS